MKTERVTLLTSPDFKAFLHAEAKREHVSVGELVRSRCERRPNEEEALAAIRDAIKLADDVKRTGETLKELSKELRDQDRRLTRLEVRWDTAMEFGARSRQRRLPNGG